MNAIRIKRYLSPVGELLVGSFDGKLCICDWAHEKRRDVNDRRIRHALHAVYEDGASDTIERAIAQLDEYFARERTAFDIPLIFTGTDFQNSVWQEYPLRQNRFLRRTGAKTGMPQSRARSSRRQRGQSDFDLRSLPSGHRKRP